MTHFTYLQLWLKPLNRSCRRILQAIDLPKHYRNGANRQCPERSLPLKKAPMDTLRDGLRKEVKAPQRGQSEVSRRLPARSGGHGAFSGTRKPGRKIQRLGQFLTPIRRVWLGWPPKNKGPTCCAPSYSALYNLLPRIDPLSLPRGPLAVVAKAGRNPSPGTGLRAAVEEATEWPPDSLKMPTIPHYRLSVALKTSPQMKRPWRICQKSQN